MGKGEFSRALWKRYRLKAVGYSVPNTLPCEEG